MTFLNFVRGKFYMMNIRFLLCLWLFWSSFMYFLFSELTRGLIHPSGEETQYSLSHLWIFPGWVKQISFSTTILHSFNNYFLLNLLVEQAWISLILGAIGWCFCHLKFTKDSNSTFDILDLVQSTDSNEVREGSTAGCKENLETG